MSKNTGAKILLAQKAFGDMAIYTTCKNNTFNGMPLPDIWVLREDEILERLRRFGYQDFKTRLGRAESNASLRTICNIYPIP